MADDHAHMSPAPAWAAGGGTKRRKTSFTPRGQACCEVWRCGLGYEYGSIRWAYLERDLCPEHTADEMVGRVMAGFRTGLAVLRGPDDTPNTRSAT